MGKVNPAAVGTKLNDKGTKESLSKLRSMPGPTASYGKSKGATGNEGCLKTAGKHLNADYAR